MALEMEKYSSPYVGTWRRFLRLASENIDMSESTDRDRDRTDEDRDRPDIKAQVAFQGDFDDDEED